MTLPDTLHFRLRQCAASVTAALLAFTGPSAALAANTTYTTNTNLVMTGPGINLLILAGSNSNNLVTTSTTFTVTVGTGDSFLLRYPGPNPGRFTNDGGLSECNLVSDNNDLTISGGAGGVGPITFTPNTTPCSSSAGGGGEGGALRIPVINLVTPNGGTFTAGTSTSITWSSSGAGIASITLTLSNNDVATFSIPIASGEANDGSFNWTVPSINGGLNSARIKIDALNSSGDIIASTMSSNSLIISALVTSNDTIPTSSITPTPALGSAKFNPTTAITNATTISDDKNLQTPPNLSMLCVNDTLIKGSQRTVYYCGRDGKRYVFPNEKTYKSWFTDFKDVVTIADTTLAQITIGGNVTYRPGIRMVKFPTDPQVYAIDAGGTFRPIPSETIALSLYGPNWNQLIDDLSDVFFVNYRMGPPITL